MNAAPHHSPEASTSALAGYPPRNDDRRWAVIRLSEGFEAATVAGYFAPPLPESTTAGSASGPAAPIQTTGEAVLEIRRRSGLTWDELARLFGVSRRSVHHWANGNPPTAQHERHVRTTLAAVRHIAEGSAAATRGRLLTPGPSGWSVFDLLTDRRFDEVFAHAAGSGFPERDRTALAPSARAARRPTHPALLLDARQDRPEMPFSKARAGRATKVPKKTGR